LAVLTVPVLEGWRFVSSPELFCPDESLNGDVGDAKVWVYEHDIDSNTGGDIQEYGQDLAMQVKREIGNQVIMPRINGNSEKLT
jgi:hypothetical protein